MPDIVAGRFRLLRVLGRGGMGEVWLAEDQVLGRKVALKRLVNAAAATDIERMFREARFAASLEHPNAVAVYDVLTVDEQPCLVMEFVDGQTLADRMAQSPMSPIEVAGLIAGVADALVQAHRRGLIHRDVKPSNVLIDRHGVAKLADFGIGREVAGSDATLTQPGHLVGTVGYLAPEVALGGRATPASDAFALGALMFAAVEGHAPLDDPEHGPEPVTAQLVRLVSAPLPKPRRAGPLTAIVEGLLARRPQDRPDLTTVAAQLRQVAAASAPVSDQDRTVQASWAGSAALLRALHSPDSTTVIRPTTGYAGGGLGADLPADRSVPNGGRRRTAWIAAASTLALVAGATAVTVWRSGHDGQGIAAPTPTTLVATAGETAVAGAGTSASPATVTVTAAAVPTSVVTRTVTVPPSAPVPVAGEAVVLQDLQPGTGDRTHLVLIGAPAVVPNDQAVVLWISPMTSGGVSHRHTYPYAVLSSGEQRTVTLNVGGAGDLGRTFVAEGCVVGATALQQVMAYRTALDTHSPAEQTYRNLGIDVSGLGSDFSCPQRLSLPRTVP